MEDSGGGAPDSGDPLLDPPSSHGGGAGALPEVIVVSEHGDVVLDATFQNSKDTIRSARKAAQTQSRHLSRGESQPQPPAPRARVRLAFRVDLAVLRKQSKYFDKLLGDAHFKEANDVADAFAALSLKGVKPRDADVRELPWIQIQDDDGATAYAYRELAFADLLRILHGLDAETPQTQITLSFVTALAVLADRFDCAAGVSRYVTTRLKPKWPVTNHKPARDDGVGSGGMSRATENVLRQKILVSWLLSQPPRFQAATKELIMYGSCQWSSFGEQEDDETTSATWWYLQDGIEQELQYRRNSILNTLASVPRHFLSLYTSARSARQCKLGYDSSVACDSYQLGEMLKFLTNKGLFFLVDFSPGSLDAIADTALLPISSIINTLRQCPSYQIDKNHTNCGLRTRMLPILDFIESLLSAASISLTHAGWKGGRAAQAWMPVENGESSRKVFANGAENSGNTFRFTRALASDQRLRLEGPMGVDKLIREVFTATSWDWTAEDQGSDHASTTPRWSFR
ncbi:hypothetical protein GGR51DRAFT_17339 [Nemania sp. FL0031]|nr:hypothetical protein GGR51DRAFT_17339 [Nemania sp. FL0031]